MYISRYKVIRLRPIRYVCGFRELGSRATPAVTDAQSNRSTGYAVSWTDFCEPRFTTAFADDRDEPVMSKTVAAFAVNCNASK